MVIVIDLGGDDETVIDGTDAKVAEAAKQDEERKQKEAYLEWIRHNEQVMPQVIPVTPGH